MTIPASRLASHSNPGHMQVVAYYLSMSATTTGLLLRRITSTVQMLQRTEKPRFCDTVGLDWVGNGEEVSPLSAVTQYGSVVRYISSFGGSGRRASNAVESVRRTASSRELRLSSEMGMISLY